MKIKKIKIDVYEWKLTFIEITKKKDYKKVIPMLKKFGVLKKVVKQTKHHIKVGSMDGGHHSYKESHRKSIILIYPSTSKKKRINVIDHEKRHCEDIILNHLNIHDEEASACLAGYLGKYLM
jgi:hypothetical protein